MPAIPRQELDNGLGGVFAASPGLDPAAIGVAVVLPTFRRPDHLRVTLASVAAQTAEVAFAVVVVENHASGMEGAAAACDVLAAGAPPGVVVVEKRAGNCNAYNAGFRAALRLFPNLTHVAIIDDDEAATPGWLAHLLAAAAEGADIIGGPQVPVFEDPDGARRHGMHPVFRPAHGASGAAGLITSTGNCLIAADVLRRMEPHLLDERFNFLGGGDTDFFTRCRAAGATFRWCAEAEVRETVPRRRTERSWITARSVRNGLISALIQRRQSPGALGRAKVVAKSAALLAASPARSLLLAARTGSLYAGSYHMMVAAGRILAEFGYTIEQYREPEKN
jgi:glycosyltransferase involved in cell wall biosynthesis